MFCIYVYVRTGVRTIFFPLKTIVLPESHHDSRVTSQRKLFPDMYSHKSSASIHLLTNDMVLIYYQGDLTHTYWDIHIPNTARGY